MKDITLLGISIIMAAFGVFFGQSTWYGLTLLSIGIAVFLFFVIKGLFDYIPRMFFDSNKACMMAEKIYEEASLKGGTLQSTHIFPRNELQDMATDKLSNVKSDVNLKFSRLMILETQQYEQKWITLLFDKISSNVDLSLKVLSKYPLFFPRLVHAVIPRINLLLYNKNNRHISMMGLDHLRLLGTNMVNFALVSHSKRVFNLLEKYFNSLQSYSQIISIKNIEEYLSICRDDNIDFRVKHVLSKIVSSAEINPNILHVGVFGSISRYLSGFLSRAHPKEQESDIDILIVYSDDKSEAKDLITNELMKELPSDQYEITWGPDENQFYEWRSPNKINIDIELIKITSFFFKQNQLLGKSIFSSYCNLYSFKESSLCDYIQIPDDIISEKDRYQIVLKDRKGLEDFLKNIRTDRENVDPRRVMSLIVRNVTWAISGQYPHSSNHAIDFLECLWENIFPDVHIDNVKEILQSGRDTARQQRLEFLSVSRKVLSSAIIFFKTD